LRGNHPHAIANALLHSKVKGETRKWGLTGGVLGSVENDDGEEENRRAVGNLASGLVSQLHEHGVDISEPFEQAASDRRKRRGWWHDLWWRPEEVSLSCKNQGKRTDEH
jgi:hypothetical protein